MKKDNLKNKEQDVTQDVDNRISQLVFKIDKLIKDEEKYNPKQLDESSYTYELGVLITANEAKLLLKVLNKIIGKQQ